jgi:RsiW-degrading membrane proteinase PrsW (M82 family)
LLLTGIGIYQMVANSNKTYSDYPLYAVGLILLTIGALLVPFTALKLKSLGTTLQTSRFMDPVRSHRSRMLIVMLLIFWALLLLAGYLLINKGLLASLTLPVFAIVGILLPICIFIIVVWPDASPLEKSRGWGALSAGMTIAPLFGTILEFGFLMLFLVFFMVILTQNSALLNDLELAATRLASGQDNPEIITNMLVSFISRPINRFLVYSVIAGLIPIIEEIAKQLPVWLLAWRKLPPRAGLLIGALGGAGFALTESLMTVSALGGTDQWLYHMLGRAGAGLMHILTGAIGGWGLASAIQGKRYTRAILAYFASVIIHSAWNAVATWDSLSKLSAPSLAVGRYSLIMLGGLFIFMLVLLLNIQKLAKDS